MCVQQIQNCPCHSQSTLIYSQSLDELRHCLDPSSSRASFTYATLELSAPVKAGKPPFMCSFLATLPKDQNDYPARRTSKLE